MITDTPTAPTLRELLKAYDCDKDGDFFRVAVGDSENIEAELLVPLKAEIASAKMWGETQAATAQDRDDQICGLEIQIAALRSQVAAADKFARLVDDARDDLPDDEYSVSTALAIALADYHADDATKAEGPSAPRFGWPIHTNADDLPEISVVCEMCESQYYWPLNDRGELELTPTQMECDCEATPPAVAPVEEDVKPLIRPTVKSDATELDKALTRGSLSPSPMYTDEQLATMEDTPPAVAAPVGEDGISPEYHRIAKKLGCVAVMDAGYPAIYGRSPDQSQNTPPAVADAAETGEDEDSRDRQFDIRLRSLEGWREGGIPKRAEMKKDVLRLEHGHQSMQEQLAALRRDVDAIAHEARDTTCTIVDTRDVLIGGLADRVEYLESRDLPQPGTVEVSDEMAKVAISAWFGCTGSQLKSMRLAIEAALAAQKARR